MDAAPSAQHLMGTGTHSGDILDEWVYAARFSLTVGFLAGTGSALVSVLIGVSAGYLGGWEDQEDAATVDATYLSATGAAVGTLTIGPVTRANRQSLTTLLLRTAPAAVPAGTRAVQITITATRQAGPYNDGYADNVAFTLRRA